jgi:hypothetical protein
MCPGGVHTDPVALAVCEKGDTENFGIATLMDTLVTAGVVLLPLILLFYFYELDQEDELGPPYVDEFNLRDDDVQEDVDGDYTEI